MERGRKRVEKGRRRVEEGEKEKEIGGKRGRGTRKVENREEEIIGDVGEEWRKGVYDWEEESGGEG